MKNLRIFQVDAFSPTLFSGNPAAVCLLEAWLSDDLMQSVAAENNLAETAFVVPMGENYGIRWFTPTVEVDLCGHATLAAGYVLLNHLRPFGSEIAFHSPRSGELKVMKRDELYFLDFPTDTLTRIADPSTVKGTVNCTVTELYKGKTDFIAVVENEAALLALKPDLAAIAALDARGLCVTAPGTTADFVSRFFAPQSGVDEDPVTGSAHTSLIPLWAEKLGKPEMTARQLSKRGGALTCIHRGSRCLIGGAATLYLEGTVFLP